VKALNPLSPKGIPQQALKADFFSPLCFRRRIRRCRFRV